MMNTNKLKTSDQPHQKSSKSNLDTHFFGKQSKIYLKAIENLYPESLNKALTPAALLLISTILAWYLTGLEMYGLSIPLVYDGDTIGTLQSFKRILDEGWYYHNTMQGYPFGAELHDYPGSDFLNLCIIKLLGIVSGSGIYALNLYLLLGFPLTTLLSYIVLKKIGIDTPYSATGAILYAFLPFHFLRFGHIFFTWYFVIPIFIYYCFKLFSDSPPFFGKKESIRSRFIDLVINLTLSSFGVYFAFLGVILIMASGVMATLDRKSATHLKSAIIFSLVVGLGFFANITPSLVYSVKNGKNPEVAVRNVAESELYGMKITQLLLPRVGHRSRKFAQLTNRYNASAPLINENSTASLGLIGTGGFLILGFVLLAAPFRKNIDRRLFVLSLLANTLVLIATIGGFSALFSLLITPIFRAWNRASIYIGFTSIGAAMLCMQILLRNKKKLVIWLVCGFLVLVGLYDQTTPYCKSCRKAIYKEYQNDKRFVEAIERTLPDGGALYQLPYMPFPEVPPLNNLPDYGLAKGYLHSSNLKWSYGGIKGREGDLFFRNLSVTPIDHQIEVIKKLGFAGIYIDRRGFKDSGEATEAAIANLLEGQKPMTSDNDQLAFFKIELTAKLLPTNITPDEIFKIAGFGSPLSPEIRYEVSKEDGFDFTRPGLPDFIEGVEGLSGPEAWGRWSDARANKSVKIVYNSPLPQNFTLVVKAWAFGPNVNQPILFQVGSISKYLIMTQFMSEYSLTFENVEKNNHALVIVPPYPRSPQELSISNDTRKLGIGFERISIHVHK